MSSLCLPTRHGHALTAQMVVILYVCLGDSLPPVTRAARISLLTRVGACASARGAGPDPRERAIGKSLGQHPPPSSAEDLLVAAGRLLVAEFVEGVCSGGGGCTSSRGTRRPSTWRPHRPRPAPRALLRRTVLRVELAHQAGHRHHLLLVARHRRDDGAEGDQGAVMAVGAAS